MEKFPKFNPGKILSIILLLGIAFSVITIVNANGVAPNAEHDSTAVSGGVATGNLFYGSTSNVLVSGAAILLSTAAGLVGVIVGGWITARRQREERRHNQIKEQLEHFYSPMLGMRELVRSKTEVRVNITATAKKLPSVESEDLTRIIEYNKEQLRKELMPLYRKMVDHFTDHLWLAEPRTRAYYRTLIEPESGRDVRAVTTGIKPVALPSKIDM